MTTSGQPAPSAPRRHSMLMVLLLSACTGRVGAATEGGGATTGSGQGTGGTSSGGALGGSGGSGSNTGGRGGVPGAVLDPGRVTMRRLNRAEYCNTVQDLLGTTQRPCDKFPTDGASHGFDTVAEVLSISPLHVENYEASAGQLVDELFALPATDARRKAVLSCTPTVAAPETCVKDILGAFARRAWRRPVTATELAPYLALLDVAKKQGGTADDALHMALQAMLMSPNFLFLVEVDGDPTSLKPHRVSDHELASRLSYAIWSSMPDAELFAAADSGALKDDAMVVKQAQRMLMSPKSHALATDFAGQWLRTRELPDHTVDATVYPTFDAALKTAMKEETDRFFDDFAKQPRPVRELLTADYTFLNDRLAKHYGYPSPGAGFTKVMLTGLDRRGLVMQGGILTLTSHPNRTSAVARGKWVLDRLLCTSPPPPPPAIPPLEEATTGTANLTMREQLAIHRQKPQCAVCHNLIDPLGLGLENYDGIGRYRATQDGKAIDSAGELPDGRKFSGPQELAGILSMDAKFDECITRHLLTFMLGRVFEDRDGSAAWIGKITSDASSKGASFGALISSVVASQPFTMRHGEQ